MPPDVSIQQLRHLGVDRGQLDDLLHGHGELTDLYLGAGLQPGPAAGGTAGTRVVGVGLAEEVRDGRATGGPALLLLVDRLGGDDAGLPRFTGRGVPIVVEEVGEVRTTAGYQARYRPVPGGVSISPCLRAYSGTLGCFVNVGNTKYVLSNNHVLADANTLPAGSTISQQSTEDGGTCPADVIAALSYYVPINIGGVTAVDAAMAAAAPGVAIDRRIIRDGDIRQSLVAPVTAPVIDRDVQKSGRTTGYTRAAKVKAVGLTIVVNVVGHGNSTFTNVFSVKRVSGSFSKAGDSGSLITTDPGNQPMGLLFASDTATLTTYANPLSLVLSALTGVVGATVDIAY